MAHEPGSDVGRLGSDVETHTRHVLRYAGPMPTGDLDRLIDAVREHGRDVIPSRINPVQQATLRRASARSDRHHES